MTPPRLRTLSPSEISDLAPQLADLLIDAIDSGASVTFLPGLTKERATAYWREAARSAKSDRRAFIVAEDDQGLAGMVQAIPVMLDNQLHRAEIAKMIVHRRARRQGLGERLMLAAEAAARALGRTVLTLDTAKGDSAERLYARLGWRRAGEIPDYALAPDGRLVATVLFWKKLD